MSHRQEDNGIDMIQNYNFYSLIKLRAIKLYKGICHMRFLNLQFYKINIKYIAESISCSRKGGMHM